MIFFLIPVIPACQVSSLKSEYLPFLDCIWLNESKLLTVGHDCVPVLFGVGGVGAVVNSGVVNGIGACQTDAGIYQIAKLEFGSGKKSGPGAGGGSSAENGGGGGEGGGGGGKFNAMQRFKSLDRNATVEKTRDPMAESVHKNSITCVRAHMCVKGDVRRVTTSAMDGNLVIWDLTSLAASSSSFSSSSSSPSSLEGALNGIHIH